MQRVLGAVVPGAMVLAVPSRASRKRHPTPTAIRPNARERRIRALQAEADRLAAQSRTVFGDLRRLELERVIKQDELLNAERALVRTTADRDAAATTPEGA